jgi:hypothetical protein
MLHNDRITVIEKNEESCPKLLTLILKSKILVLPHQQKSAYIPINVCCRRVPATYDGIWDLITTSPPDSSIILTVFMHDPVAVNCSQNTDFRASSLNIASCQNIFLISRTSPVPPNSPYLAEPQYVLSDYV